MATVEWAKKRRSLYQHVTFFDHFSSSSFLFVPEEWKVSYLYYTTTNTRKKEDIKQYWYLFNSMHVHPFTYKVIGGSFRVTLVVDRWFLPKILGPWWGPTKAIYRSVNTDRVIILFAGGGGTWTQFSVIKVVWTFCTERWWGAKNQIFWSCKSVVQIN